ncbi:hypothetical protein ABIE65_002261 [Constrictibacter sp. MBR-5]|jgi:hypothetical protein|uniref:cellulose binding domain-containing protein n=1 Tax=Constrictibacter sp. MBR-5 TaxID=3156467 RepID=UPI003391B464
MKAGWLFSLVALAAFVPPLGGPARAADAAFEVTGDRQENFRAAVTLGNPEDRKVGDWTLEMRLDRTVVQAFGAEAEQVEKGLWRFRPVDWTKEIPAKGEVRFTFIGRPGGLGTAQPDMKLDVTYVADTPVAQTPAPSAPPPAPAPAQGPAPSPAPAPSAAGAAAPAQPEKAAGPAAQPGKTAAPTPADGTAVAHTLGFKLKDSWPDGFVGEVAVVNGSDKTLRPWRFEFALDGKIDQAWGAVVKPAGAGRWVAVPEAYNKELEPGAFATFGFKATTPFKSRPSATALKQGG